MILPILRRKILPFDTLSGLQFFQLFRYGSVFLISIILPRAGLAKADIGLFESFVFFAGIVSYFWVTGLIQALLPLATTDDRRPMTDARGLQSADCGPLTARALPLSPERSDGGRGGQGGEVDGRSLPSAVRGPFFNSFVLLLLFSVLAALALWLCSPLLGKLVGQELPRELVWMVMLYLVLYAPSTLVEYGYVLADQTKKLVRYGITAFTIQILLVGIPVILGLGVKAAIWGMIAAGGFRMIWLIVMLIRNGEFSISLPFWKEYLALGGPVILSVLLSGSAQYVNGFIITARFDSGIFAIFRYGAREMPLVALLAYALSSAMVPVITRDGRSSGLKMLRERSSAMASWLFPMTCILILLSYLLFPLVYGRDFLESAGVFNLFLLLITSRLLFPQTVLLAMQKTRIQMIAAFLELVLNIGLSLLLVRLWGIRGVAFATVIAYYFEKGLLMAYTGIKLGIPVVQYTDIRKHLTWTAIMIGAYLAAELVVYPLMAD